MKNSRNITSCLTILLLIGWVASSCSSPTIQKATPTSGAILATKAETASPQAPHTPTPTLTPTPQPARLLLIIPPGANSVQGQVLQEFFQGKASEAGMQMLVQESLSAANLDEHVSAVVVLPPFEGLQSLAAGAPQVNFLAYDFPDLQPSQNLSVIARQERPDQVAFMAGYIAAMITTDWRVGSITLAGGTNRRDGFANGAVYFCGLCRQVFPPYSGYPLNVELPDNNTPAERQVAVEYMIDHVVNTVYVAPGLDDPQTLQALAEAEINILAEREPPAEAQELWAVSLMSDPYTRLEEAWTNLLHGEPGQAYVAEMQLQNSTETIFSPGRQSLAEKILQELLGGFVDTGVALP